MPGNDGHKCKHTDLVRSNKPACDPDGNTVSFTVRCRGCGKTYEEVYTRAEGLWDPDRRRTVFLQ
jgi:hypothetical protein